jgi:adenylate cyclase
LVNRDDDSQAIEITTDPNGKGRLLVNHRGPSRGFHHYSFYDAYHNKFTKKELQDLKGSVLLLGGTATGTNDLRPNVFDPAIDGVENHAAVMDNIIKGDYLKRSPTIYRTELLIVLFVGLLFSPLAIWGSSLISGAAVIVFLMGYWYVDWKLWFLKGTWAYIGIPSLEILGLFITTMIYKYATEEREKKKVKGAFEHYLSPDVIKEVLDDPKALSLGGKRQEITVFFSDVRSFTTISESLSPEKLSEFMNHYFTPMTSIILTSGGTLDKYIGDAIMAFWGAPISHEDHAQRAARSVINMLYALDKLREELPKIGFPKPDIGIGLNTGPMSVGNMGSAARFSYTVMGDAVNLGARLESLTKEYKIKAMISEFTAKKLDRKEFLYRDLDDIRVKGKNEPVKVFELMRPDMLPQEAAIRNLIGEFEAGRAAYTKQTWDVAEKHFSACLMIKPDDGPTGLFLERIAEFKAQSPGQTWDGVYTFKHK